MFTRYGSRGGGGLGDQSKHGDHRREHRVQNERRVDVRVSELSKEQREKVKTAKRISNPGCYPTGFIGLMLLSNKKSGFIPKGLRTTVNAVSGYTGGGKQLIAIYESPEAEPYGAYGFNLNHKHIPEMRKSLD